jgi:ATP-dependent phosphofructokinase / diphosphate-dependent phosphofructokinase
MTIKRISICTGGGDAPGLNAVIRSAVSAALNRGWECYGIRDGYTGLLEPEIYGERGGIVPLTRETVTGITNTGGTILGTSNQGQPFKRTITDETGQTTEIDLTDKLVAAFHAARFDALIAIGGDGSMAAAHTLYQRGIPVVGVPKTIDNDLHGTVITFGFDTAVSFATECIDRLRVTAESHHRTIVVEVMGRYAGWIALNAGVSGTADVILIPEIRYDIDKVAAKIEALRDQGSDSAIIVVAEGARAVGEKGTDRLRQVAGGRLSGVGTRIARRLEALLDLDTRVVVLGHLLRGGTPTTFDRLISLRFGAAAVRALEEGQFGCMVGLDPPTVRYVPLDVATRQIKRVPLNSDTILTARDLGICFGD